MRPRRTPESNLVLSLPGGNEDHDLWCQVGESGDGTPIVVSVWVPTDKERARIANGENIALAVFGPQHPPVNLLVTPEGPRA